MAKGKKHKDKKDPPRGGGSKHPNLPLATAQDEAVVEQPAQVPVDAGSPGDFDAALERFLSSQQQQADVARAQANEARGTLHNQFFNPADPFSRQALLEKSLGDSLREGLYSTASRGQLYSGALEESQAATRFAGQQDYDAMMDEYAERAGGIDRDLADRLGALGQSSEQAIFDRTHDYSYDVMNSDATTPAAARGPAPAGGRSVNELKRIRERAKARGNNKRIRALNSQIDDVRAYKQTPHPSTQLAAGPRPGRPNPRRKRKNR